MGWMAGLILVLSSCTRIQVAPPPEIPSTPPPRVSEGPEPSPFTTPDVEEVKGVWVVRFTMTSEASVRSMVERASGAGINTLIVQVRGRADAFYSSTLEPRGESVREDEPFDPLSLTIELARERGMEVHAWVNTHLVWGPAAPPIDRRHLVRANPDWLAVPRHLADELLAVDPFEGRFFDTLVLDAEANDDRVEGIYTSPSHPEVQDRVLEVWLDLAARYDLDGIHFDYIRFPSAQYDYSIGALERFRIWLRGRVAEDRFRELDDAYERDLFAMVDGESEAWSDFRREQVDRLVLRIRDAIREVKPGLTISAAVIADRQLAYDDRFQDWARWLEEGWIDVAVPMAYTPDLTRFTELVDEARRAAGDPARVWAGIGAYMNSADGTIRMIDAARGADAGGIVLFSYDWIVGEGRGSGTPYLERLGQARLRR